MNKKKSIFANNLKKIRKTYNESQMDLALAIDQEATSISNYENGKRMPDFDTINRIASHYRIPVDLFFSNDLQISTKDPKSKINMEMIAQYDSELIPIIFSEEALKNDLFNKAYTKHKKLIESKIKGISVSSKDIESYINDYADCIEKYYLDEAYCNYLSFLIQLECAINNYNIVKGLNSMEGDMLYADFQKEIYLNDIEIDKEIDDEYITSLDDHIADLLSILKTTKYSDLADYFIAFRYISGGRCFAEYPNMHKVFGEDFMTILAQMKNKYALNFFSLREKFLKSK